MTADKPTVTPLTAEEEAALRLIVADTDRLGPWGERVARLLATLDAARTDSLDVERLARALWNADAKAAGWTVASAPYDQVLAKAKREISERAASVAAEYAALSAALDKEPKP